MENIEFQMTDDGSIGLYNKEIDDIYHSRYGAYTESLEKFIRPSGLIEYAKYHDYINILDICYGIGYNTKVSLNELYKFYKDEKILDINIDALEIDKNLVELSPFLKNQKINNEINNFIIEKLVENKLLDKSIVDKIFTDNSIEKFLNSENKCFFIKKNKEYRMQEHLKMILPAFLHNIYYNYIANRYKNRAKNGFFNKTSLEFHLSDARKAVFTLKRKYNFIYLDAFTPTKLPTLWTYEFLKKLYDIITDDGIFITYTSSVTIRSTLKDLGFYVGKTLDNKNKSIGTIASKNKKMLKYLLTDYELEMLNSKTGIYYRDPELSNSSEKILQRREAEVLNSEKISASKVRKNHEKTL